MNREEYSKFLRVRVQKMHELREASISIAHGIIGNSLYKEDFFFSSALKKNIDLLDGMINMLNERNLTCAGIVVRSQIDNCMRIFAAFIAEDKTALIDGFFQGKRFSDFKDNRGNKMKDAVLRERLEEYDFQISKIYNKASGYVHLSASALHLCVSTKDNYKLEISIGRPIKDEANEVLLEVADVFIHYTLLVQRLLQGVVESKHRADNDSGSLCDEST